MSLVDEAFREAVSAMAVLGAELRQRPAAGGKREQLNVRVRAGLRARVGTAAATSGLSINMFVEQALDAACDAHGVPNGGPPAVDGQLTVDDAQTTGRDLDPRESHQLEPSAHRRPRAAEQAERSSQGSTSESSEAVNVSGTRSREHGAGRRNREAVPSAVDRSVPQTASTPGDASAAVEPDGPAGCPECAGELEHGKCVDCGWLVGSA